MTTGYATQELGRIARFEYGKSQKAVRSLDGTIPVYGTGGLMEYANASLHSGPSVIVGRKGSLGNPLYSNGPFWAVDTTYYAAECNGNMRWLHYVLCSVRLEYFNEATGVPSLARPTLNGIRVPYPSSDEQDSIVQVLTKIDRAIDQTGALLAKQRRIKTGLMHNLLTRGLDAQGKLRDPSSHSFYVSKLGPLPNGWKVESLESLLAKVPNPMRSGPFGSALLKSDLAEIGHPLLGIDNVFVERFASNYSRFVDDEQFENLSRYAVKPLDIMVTIMGTVGRCCVVPEFIGKALSSKHTWTVSLDLERYSPHIACWQINHAEWILGQLRRDEQGGVMSSIQSATLRSLLFPVPPPDETLAIERLYLGQNRQIAEIENLLSKLRRLKEGLMHDLLTGEVPVAQLLGNLKAPISS